MTTTSNKPSRSKFGGELPVPSLRHLALYVERFEACVDFYTRLIGFEREWTPDSDNIYLTTGADNLALHRAAGIDPEGGALDHLGLMLASLDQVDEMHRWLSANGVEIVQTPRLHRDGAYSFYCRDPDGNRVQIIYHPPLVSSLSVKRRTQPVRKQFPKPGDSAPLDGRS